jgi:hypothetical protein
MKCLAREPRRTAGSAGPQRQRRLGKDGLWGQQEVLQEIRWAKNIHTRVIGFHCKLNAEDGNGTKLSFSQKN